MHCNTKKKQQVVKIHKNVNVKIVIMVITKGDYLCLDRIKVDHYNVLTAKQKAKIKKAKSKKKIAKSYSLNHEKKN